MLHPVAGRWPGPTPITLALLALALAPLAVIPIPAMIDYVNHLARMYLLVSPGPHPGYVVTWQFAPNLAMDLLVPALAQLMPVGVAARLFVALSYVLVVSGAIAVERAVKGRHQLAGLCAMPLLFSTPFAWGLANFTFGLGLALWGLALWVGARKASLLWRWALHALLCAALFTAHFFALGLYGFILGLMEFPALLRPCFGRGKAAGPRWLPDPACSVCRAALGRAAGLAVLLASPVAVLLALMHAGDGSLGGRIIDWDFALKLHWPLAFLNEEQPVLARLSALVAALLVGIGVARKGLRLSPEGKWVAAGLLLLYIVLPRRLFDVAYVDVRVLAAAALVLPAFLTIRPWRGGAVALILLALVNGATTTAAWVRHQSDYREFRASFAQLTPGAAVLVARATGSTRSDAALFYAPTLAAPEAGVFVASLYAFGGMQPVEPAPAFAPLAVAEGLDYLPVALNDLLAGAPPPHALQWGTRYRYLYVIGPPIPSPRPGLLQRVAAGARFTLFRIEPAACSGAASTGPACSEPPPGIPPSPALSAAKAG
jgi:hypothetical protein